MTTSPKPVDTAADEWHVLRNRTFDEIAIGDSASVERAFSSQDIHMFALQSGDVDQNLLCPQALGAPRRPFVQTP